MSQFSLFQIDVKVEVYLNHAEEVQLELIERQCSVSRRQKAMCGA